MKFCASQGTMGGTAPSALYTVMGEDTAAGQQQAWMPLINAFAIPKLETPSASQRMLRTNSMVKFTALEYTFMRAIKQIYKVQHKPVILISNLLGRIQRLSFAETSSFPRCPGTASA